MPRGWLLGIVDLRDNIALYYTVAGIFLLGYFVVWRIAHSTFGQVLRAIRDNQPRMISLGYPVDRYKLLNFVLSAALAGRRRLAQGDGVGLATLTDVHWSTSGEVVLMVLLGGLGTLFGPVVGASVDRLDGQLSGRHRHAGAGGDRADFHRLILMFRRGIVGEILYRLSRRGSRIGQ